MIGAGIFILPGVAARNAGPASSVSFALAGLVALLAALGDALEAQDAPVDPDVGLAAARAHFRDI